MYRPRETRGCSRLQVTVCALLALSGWILSGSIAAISALLGGLIILFSGWLSASIVGLGVRKGSAGNFLGLLLAAEMAKLLFVVIALLLVWLCFPQVSWQWEVLGCIAAFSAYGLTLLINSRRR